MNINLKQTLKKDVLQYMRDNEIDVECMESIELTKEEMKRGIKEGSVKTYYTYGLPITLAGYPAMKINDKVIPITY
jgi:hypothetical protein